MNTSSNIHFFPPNYNLFSVNIISGCILTYFALPSKFEKEQWKSRNRPTPEQLRDLRLNGWKSSRGKRGPNFFDWFKEEVIQLKPFILSTVTFCF